MSANLVMEIEEMFKLIVLKAVIKLELAALYSLSWRSTATHYHYRRAFAKLCAMIHLFCYEKENVGSFNWNGQTRQEQDFLYTFMPHDDAAVVGFGWSK